jgi:hypothetical protein
VKTDVDPSADGLRAALRSFAVMPEHGGAIGIRDPLSDLESALRERGVAPDIAERAIGSFRGTGEVEDV